MKKYLLLLLLVVLFPLVVALLFQGKSAPQTNTNLPTPTPVALPTTSPPPSTFQYSKTDTDKLLNTIDNRTPLSSSDASVKANLITLSNPQTDILYQTSDFTLFYIRSADVFQVEIDTINVDSAKQNVVSYLSSQGLSQSGICNLPLVFYLQVSIRDQLKENGYIFSPLAPGC